MNIKLLDGGLKRYKANLHCHTTVSDGNLTPEEVKKLYKENGYSVIAFTDHDVMLAHDYLNDDGFLALHGYEMEITNEIFKDKTQKTCHMCLIQREPNNMNQVCWNRSKYLFGNAPKYIDQIQFDDSLPDYERTRSGECISEMMQKGRENGFFVTYNHPSWSLEDYTDYMNYHGMHAMEICNYGCCVEGYDDYNPRVYDEMLRGGEHIYCIAADDNHNVYPFGTGRSDACGAFTVIFAKDLSYKKITDALFAGNFYASQGPEIYSLSYEDGILHIKCSPVEKMVLSTNRRSARCAFMEDKSFTEAEFKVYEDDKYVRITITDEKGRHANTNAYWRDELIRI